MRQTLRRQAASITEPHRVQQLLRLSDPSSIGRSWAEEPEAAPVCGLQRQLHILNYREVEED